MIVFLIIAGVFSYIGIAAIVYAIVAEDDPYDDADGMAILWPVTLILLIAFAVMNFPVWLGGKLRNWYEEWKEGRK